MSAERTSSYAMLRSRQDIGRILEAVLVKGEPIVSYLNGGELLFVSRARRLELSAGRIVLDSSRDNAANAALLGMARCTFHTSLDGWHVEFAASNPEKTTHEGRPAIQLGFPEILTRWRRENARTAVYPRIPLQVVADHEGVTPFDGQIVDIGPEGIGFLVHSADITLEPGTILKSCLVEIPGRTVYKVDIEVCYSQPVTLADGARAMRSGCRFVDLNGPAKELIALFMSFQPAASA